MKFCEYEPVSVLIKGINEVKRIKLFRDPRTCDARSSGWDAVWWHLIAGAAVDNYCKVAWR